MAPSINARGLTKHFGGVPALDDLSFEVAEQEILCIVGPNGAGKSTLFRVLSGVMKPDSGEVSLFGTNVKGMPSRSIARLGVSTKFQIPRVFPTLTVSEHVSLASRVGSTIPQLLGFRGIDGKLRKTSPSEVLEMMELDELKYERAGELGHGQRQWLEIAMTVATNPRVLMLDEPGAGMSPEEKTKTADLIRRLSDVMTVLVIEHDLSFIKSIAQRVLVMNLGALLTQGTFDEISTNAEVKRVYLGSEE